MSYGPNFSALFRRAAELVDTILRGTKPGDIPIEQPTKFDLVVNLTTAKALGLTIPESFLSLADEVIEWPFSLQCSWSGNGTKRTWHSHLPMSAFGGIADIAACLLYPQKRTLELSLEMSALCQKRTFRIAVDR